MSIIAIRVEIDMHNADFGAIGNYTSPFHSVRFNIPHDHPLTQALADYNNQRLRAEYLKYIASLPPPPPDNGALL